jgi:hypothetical protein
MVRVVSKCLQTGLFSGASAAYWPPGTYWVPGDADAPADCARKKDLQMQVFSRAAEGIRTLDLLHGKQYIRELSASEMPANGRFPTGWTEG